MQDCCCRYYIFQVLLNILFLTQCLQVLNNNGLGFLLRKIFCNLAEDLLGSVNFEIVFLFSKEEERSSQKQNDFLSLLFF